MAIVQPEGCVGAITDTYEYDAFGNRNNSTATTPNDYLYRGCHVRTQMSLVADIIMPPKNVRLLCRFLNQKQDTMKKKRGSTVADYRRLALSMPGAVEGSHWGNADFRVGGRIFCTTSLVKEGYGVLKLTPEEQAGMVADAPEVFSPVPGGWGEMGMTRVRLDAVTEDVLEGAIRVAWRLRVKKSKGKA